MGLSAVTLTVVQEPRVVHDHHRTYVFALVGVNVVGATVAAALWWGGVELKVFASLMTGVFSLAGLLVAGALRELHLAMNSRLSQLLDVTRVAAWETATAAEKARAAAEAVEIKLGESPRGTR